MFYQDSDKQDAIALGCAAVNGLIQKVNLNPENVDEIIWGNVGKLQCCKRVVVVWWWWHLLTFAAKQW